MGKRRVQNDFSGGLPISKFPTPAFNFLAYNDYSNQTTIDYTLKTLTSNTLSMHSCLSVDEILRLIACELAASTGQAATIALARCCKSFEDPALDALWETQDRLIPLLKSLPGDVWDGDTCTSFKRLPTSLELARFRKYARRMRSFRGPGDPSFLCSEAFAVLQSCAINEAFLPNLKYFHLWATGESIPFVPSFLSPTTTTIEIEFMDHADRPNAVFASMVTAIQTLCPNLQKISLRSLPRDPIITVAVSELVLTTNRGALRQLRVDSPLTEEAREVIYKLPDLCGLTVVVEGSTSLPTMVLPNLTEMDIEYNHTFDWLEGFRGATLGNLNSITFRPKSESAQITDFLEAFESVGLTTSTSLSTFRFHTRRSWRPNYRPLVSFKQLTELEIGFSCEGGCSSTINDDIITELAQAMPRLEALWLGGEPCGTPTGVTAKGLAALASHCPNLSHLRIHFRADSFNALPAISGTPCVGTAVPQRECALTDLDVGQIPIPEESTLMVAQTLVRIFPNITRLDYPDDSEDWEKVFDAI